MPGKILFHSIPAKASIDSETLPDPGVVAGLEANKLLPDPHFLSGLVVETEVSLAIVGMSGVVGKDVQIYGQECRQAGHGRARRTRREVGDGDEGWGDVGMCVYGDNSLTQSSRLEYS
jgi:hypothetical protein